MSPEGPRSGLLAAWIVVVRRRTATANIHRELETNTVVRLANGTPPCSARNGESTSASDPIRESGAGSDSRATYAEAPRLNASGRATISSIRAGQRRPDRRRRLESTATATPENVPRPSGRKTRANIKVGTLNVCGKGALYGEENKWTAIHRLVRDKKLGILAIQETHLLAEDIATIHNLYGRRL